MADAGVRGERNVVRAAVVAVAARALGCGGSLAELSWELRAPSGLRTTAIPPATSIGAHS